MEAIAQPVGEGGVNLEADVRKVQTLLNPHAAALAIAPLDVNGKADAPTIAAIRLFQTLVANLRMPDGRIDPLGRTLRVLNGDASAAGAPFTAPAGNLSGRQWLLANQARFPNSAAVSALEPGFASRVSSFISALRAAGAMVQVSATRRNKVRAHLMHFSWRVAKDGFRAGDVPAEPQATIVWDHGDDDRSRDAAQEMVDFFGIVFQPSLTSRHIDGLAIDMAIAWNGSITVRGASGTDVRLSSPSDGSNTALHAVGAGYGVRKLLSDPPHWSADGH